MGCLTALNQLEEWGLPLYKLMRKSDRFTWTPEAQQALDVLKALLTKAPVLVPPVGGEPLLLYVAATTQVVCVALVVEREEEGHTLKVQMAGVLCERDPGRYQNSVSANLEIALCSADS